MEVPYQHVVNYSAKFKAFLQQTQLEPAMMGLNNRLSLFATRFWHEAHFASTFSDTWRIDNEEFLLLLLLAIE